MLLPEASGQSHGRLGGLGMPPPPGRVIGAGRAGLRYW